MRVLQVIAGTFIWTGFGFAVGFFFGLRRGWSDCEARFKNWIPPWKVGRMD